MVQMEGGLFGVRAGTDSGSLAIFSGSGWKSEALGFGDAISPSQYLISVKISTDIYQGLRETH